MYLFFVKAAFISKYLHDPVCKYKFRYLQKKKNTLTEQCHVWPETLKGLTDLVASSLKTYVPDPCTVTFLMIPHLWQQL